MQAFPAPAATPPCLPPTAQASYPTDHPYRLSVLRRALGRSDRELFGRRALYAAVARRIAGDMIGAGL